MKTVGRGVYEIQIASDGDAFRIFYVAKLEDAAYVLHAFEKKSQKTPLRDIEIGRERYKELMGMRMKR